CRRRAPVCDPPRRPRGRPERAAGGVHPLSVGAAPLDRRWGRGAVDPLRRAGSVAGAPLWRRRHCDRGALAATVWSRPDGRLCHAVAPMNTGQVADTQRAFDEVAAGSGGPLGHNRLVQALRARTLAAVTRAVAPGASLLDLGCGTGLD